MSNFWGSKLLRGIGGGLGARGDMPTKRPASNAADDDDGDEAATKAEVKRFFKMLKPFAAKDGKSFCRYPVPESMKLREGITNSGKMLAHKELAPALDKHVDGMRLKQSVTLKAAETSVRYRVVLRSLCLRTAQYHPTAGTVRTQVVAPSRLNRVMPVTAVEATAGAETNLVRLVIFFRKTSGRTRAVRNITRE